MSALFNFRRCRLCGYSTCSANMEDVGYIRPSRNTQERSLIVVEKYIFVEFKQKV